MNCQNPVLALRLPVLNENGKSVIKIIPASSRPDYNIRMLEERYGKDCILRLPCGKCTSCKENYRADWSVRCDMEARCHTDNVFLTLTYRPETCPRWVSKGHVRKFIRNLRKSLHKSSLYFACGEYGETNGRPHYHMIIFGWLPSDLEFLKVTKRGENIYRSKFLEKIWPLGYVSVGDLTLQSAKYTALYMQKLVKRKPGQDPPFQLMSKSPGIGAGAFDPKMVKTDKVYHAGKYVKLPRYYLTLAERQGIDLSELKSIRAKKRQLFHKSILELQKSCR